MICSKKINLILSRRQVKKSKSMLQVLLFGDDNGEEDIKSKNIRQTEILVDLREAILQVARHFISTDPNLQQQTSKVSLNPDYSMESHAKDHEGYVSVSRNRHRRAKALLGWFPAKFVELLDERSKQYSCAGDDSVSQAVTDLVRGTLCPAIKQVLEHGMKRPSFLGGPCHPWLFIEEAAAKEVERDFESVYSRLVLCKTYRLDEDGKVLTPEEDFRYHPWSFVYSPGWVQVKCELRVLSQFAFSLSPDWELPPHARRSHHSQNLQPLKDGVRDMLVKHHLFSWDL
ncbi:hypothetical protein J437_LFUL016640 [Ladona fulva]|uniref:RUN domain-containing protein n=1 Tax=Ladona fulva TaxID=123851 RepID=A0A8K0PC78_LADFU|nr:hypothetical protein J437_LFUL016640 [Ladona fulva]